MKAKTWFGNDLVKILAVSILLTIFFLGGLALLFYVMFLGKSWSRDS